MLRVSNAQMEYGDKADMAFDLTESGKRDVRGSLLVTAACEGHEQGIGLGDSGPCCSP